MHSHLLNWFHRILVTSETLAYVASCATCLVEVGVSSYRWQGIEEAIIEKGIEVAVGYIDFEFGQSPRFFVTSFGAAVEVGCVIGCRGSLEELLRLGLVNLMIA